jgi:hypothetical protein
MGLHGQRTAEERMMEQETARTKRKWNWRIWAGLLTSVVALLSYVTLFYKYPLTRDVPWVNFLMFAAGGALLFAGLRKAYVERQIYRGKIFGPIAATVSAGILGLFCYGIFYAAKQLPKSSEAPKPGQRAPDFTMVDSTGKSHSLSSLLSEPMEGPAGVETAPRAAILVFYRGYW